LTEVKDRHFLTREKHGDILPAPGLGIGPGMEKGMQYLVATSDSGPVDWASKAEELRREAAHVLRLHTRGLVRQIWFTEDRDAILILEAPDLEAARAIAEGLPLVREGLLRYRITSLLPYTGWERLIDG